MRQFVILALLGAGLVLQPTAASAYIGPGLGVGAITAVLGVFMALIMAFAALLWYPVKRLLRGRRVSTSEPPRDGK